MRIHRKLNKILQKLKDFGGQNSIFLQNLRPFLAGKTAKKSLPYDILLTLFTTTKLLFRHIYILKTRRFHEKMYALKNPHSVI